MTKINDLITKHNSLEVGLLTEQEKEEVFSKCDKWSYSVNGNNIILTNGTEENVISVEESVNLAEETETVEQIALNQVLIQEGVYETLTNALDRA